MQLHIQNERFELKVGQRKFHILIVNAKSFKFIALLMPFFIFQTRSRFGGIFCYNKVSI